MKLNIIGRHIEITPAMKDFVEKKLQRLNRRDDNIMSIQITLHVEKASHIADAILHVKGTELHATATDKDMYSAIDTLADKISAQLIKHKEKIISR